MGKQSFSVVTNNGKSHDFIDLADLYLGTESFSSLDKKARDTLTFAFILENKQETLSDVVKQMHTPS